MFKEESFSLIYKKLTKLVKIKMYLTLVSVTIKQISFLPTVSNFYTTQLSELLK